LVIAEIGGCERGEVGERRKRTGERVVLKFKRCELSERVEIGR
jgi:hypothetical protein